MPLSAEQRRARARRAALVRWAGEDPEINARRGQAGLRNRIELNLEAAGKLPADLAPQERCRRIEAGIKAHFARLSFLSAKARAASPSDGDAA